MSLPAKEPIHRGGRSLGSIFGYVLVSTKVRCVRTMIHLAVATIEEPNESPGPYVETLFCHMIRHTATPKGELRARHIRVLTAFITQLRLSLTVARSSPAADSQPALPRKVPHHQS